jgi:NAD(P)-dependent dehydrogenase (short-subunit alcohol dehydrogenase family)
VIAAGTVIAGVGWLRSYQRAELVRAEPLVQRHERHPGPRGREHRGGKRWAVDGQVEHRWQQAGPFVEAVYSEFGRCDVFVNNAGMSPRYDSIADVTEAMLDSVVNVCFKGPFRLAVLFGDRMCAAGLAESTGYGRGSP